MTELMKKAIAKIDAESEKGGSNQKRIAQYIIDDLITDDISAEKIKVIVKDPGKPARVVWISNTLENLQRTVGGYIETVTISTDVVIICNEEGKLLGLPHNCRLCGCDFVGTLIIVGIDKDEFCSLSDEVIRLLKPVIKEKKS